MKKLIILIVIIFSLHCFSQNPFRNSSISSAGNNTNARVDRLDTIIGNLISGLKGSIKNNQQNDRKLQYIRRIDSCKEALDTLLKKKFKDLSGANTQLSKDYKSLGETVIKSLPLSSPVTIDTADIHKSKINTANINKFLHAYQRDSIELNKLNQMIVGRHFRQDGYNPGVYASYFQGFPTLADDNPQSYSFWELNGSMPLNRFKGKIKNLYPSPMNMDKAIFPKKDRDTLTPNMRPAVCIGFRNIDITFIRAFSKKGLYANELTRFDTIDKRRQGSNFINLLDLKQNAFFSFIVDLNLLTIINEENGLALYFDVFCSWSRTTVAKPNIIYDKDSVTSIQKSDSMYVTNFNQYGLKFTMKTNFKDSHLNFRFNTQLFWVDPTSNTFSILNPQFNKLPYLTPQDKRPYEFKPNYTLKNLESYPYFAFNLTLKYNLGKSSSATGSKTSSSASISSSSPTFLYASFGYYSSINFIGPSRAVNNYMSLQIGYSMDLNSLVKTLQTALGLNKSSS